MEHDHMVQALPPNGTNHPLCVGPLPRRARRSTRMSLAAAEINEVIVERYYQQRAIRRIGEAFENDHERKALVVMATGAGKTRTVIALCDLMMRCNWVKRVLFLADRIALVKQTANVFKKHLPSAGAVRLEKAKQKRKFAITLITTTYSVRYYARVSDGMTLALNWTEELKK